MQQASYPCSEQGDHYSAKQVGHDPKYSDHRSEYPHLCIREIICGDIGVIIIESEERKREDDRTAERQYHDRPEILSKPALDSKHL